MPAMETGIHIAEGRQRSPFVRCAGIILFLLLFAAACEHRNDVVPHYLIGTWKTSAQEYADRYLEIGEHTLELGVGDGKKVTYRIEEIEVKQAGNSVVTLSYRDPEGEQGMLTFIYRSGEGGTLHLKNSPHIWKRAETGGER
jgi:hypothetical protein